MFFSRVGEIVDTSQLRQQQITLGLLKAARVLCSRQDNLRQILSHQASSSDGSSTFSLQHLMCSAIKPSPIKALFDREELEVIIQSGQGRKMKLRYVHGRYYKLIAILRRQYRIILTASWEKIYSVLGGVAKRRSPIRNIFSPNAVNIMWYCRLKIAISFVSRSIIYKDK